MREKQGGIIVSLIGEALPELLDCAKLARELGITKAAAEAIMRRLPLVKPEGLRKVYVRRDDVLAFIGRSEHCGERRRAWNSGPTGPSAR